MCELRSVVSEEARALQSSVSLPRSRFLDVTQRSKFGGIKFFAESVHRSAFAAQTRSFLCGKFSTARLEVVPNLRHVGVFQMSTMVNLGIGFQEPLTRPGVNYLTRQ